MLDVLSSVNLIKIREYFFLHICTQVEVYKKERKLKRTDEFNGSLTFLINKRLELEWMKKYIKKFYNGNEMKHKLITLGELLLSRLQIFYISAVRHLQ